MVPVGPLVAAVDKIEALMRTVLTEHTVPGVIEELLRLAAVARDALGTDDIAKSEVDEVGLLRRQIARRCIYGLDINPNARLTEMAVRLNLNEVDLAVAAALKGSRAWRDCLAKLMTRVAGR